MNNQEFKIHDKVIDILIMKVGEIVSMTSMFQYYPIKVIFDGDKEIQDYYTEQGLRQTNFKTPSLLHYVEGYDYNKIDFDNLPKRDENNHNRWKAKKGEEFYFIGVLFEVIKLEVKGHNDIFETNLYLNNNYFKTEEEAQIIAIKMKRHLETLIKN